MRACADLSGATSRSAADASIATSESRPSTRRSDGPILTCSDQASATNRTRTFLFRCDSSIRACPDLSLARRGDIRPHFDCTRTCATSHVPRSHVMPLRQSESVAINATSPPDTSEACATDEAARECSATTQRLRSPALATGHEIRRLLEATNPTDTDGEPTHRLATYVSSSDERDKPSHGSTSPRDKPSGRRPSRQAHHTPSWRSRLVATCQPPTSLAAAERRTASTRITATTPAASIAATSARRATATPRLPLLTIPRDWPSPHASARNDRPTVVRSTLRDKPSHAN